MLDSGIRPSSSLHRNMPCENEDMLHADENMLISDPQVVPSPHVLPGHNRLRKCQTQQISLLLPGPTMIVSLTRDAENLVQHDLIALDALLELQARARPKPRLTNLQTRGRPTIRFGWQQGRFTSCGSEFTYVQELTRPLLLKAGGLEGKVELAGSILACTAPRSIGRLRRRREVGSGLQLGGW